MYVETHRLTTQYPFEWEVGVYLSYFVCIFEPRGCMSAGVVFHNSTRVWMYLIIFAQDCVFTDCFLCIELHYYLKVVSIIFPAEQTR